MMGATKDKMTIKKVSMNMTLDVIKGINDSTIVYLKAKIYLTEGF